MSFSDDETELDQMLGEMEIDRLNWSPESVGGVESPSADVNDSPNPSLSTMVAKSVVCVKLTHQYPLEKINEGDFSICAQGNDPSISYEYFARASLPHNLNRVGYMTWPRPHSLIIND